MTKRFRHKRFTAVSPYSRLDHFLNESMPEMSRSQVVKLLKAGHVKLNEKTVLKKNLEIEIGDTLEIEFEESEESELQKFRPTIQLKKLFEDENVLIIDKPTGVSVHPGSGEQTETILDVFRFYYPQINEIPDEERPGIVHRLDKDTSGVLLLAKDVITMKRLQKQFKRREVHKIYLALVTGQMRYRNGTINAPIARSTRNRTKFRVVDEAVFEETNAREAVTDYSVIGQYNDFSYVMLQPHTGRTHQLRVHLSHSGNPILGDPLYGKPKTFKRLALHAHSIEFVHPFTHNVIRSFSPVPTEIRLYLKEKKAFRI
jgi:23S rRNA pseudouridine1911/1915/1917 synthase